MIGLILATVLAASAGTAPGTASCAPTWSGGTSGTSGPLPISPWPCAVNPVKPKRRVTFKRVSAPTGSLRLNSAAGSFAFARGGEEECRVGANGAVTGPHPDVCLNRRQLGSQTLILRGNGSATVTRGSFLIPVNALSSITFNEPAVAMGEDGQRDLRAFCAGAWATFTLMGHGKRPEPGANTGSLRLHVTEGALTCRANGDAVLDSPQAH